ncbi:MAG: signal peptidase I [Spirochaetota bacterium]
MLTSPRGQRFGKPRPPRPFRRFALRLLRLIIILIILLFLISGLLIDTYEVGSAAMEPQIFLGERLLATPVVFGAYLPGVDRRLPSFREPQRGDVVTVSPPFLGESGFLTRIGRALLDVPMGRRAGNPLDDPADWASLSIRRVIAVPGDTVRMDDFTFYVRTDEGEPFVNEFELSPQGYDVRIEQLPAGWRSSHPLAGEMEQVTLGEDEYFVAGDNRGVALDSRDYGVVDFRDIRSLVLMRYWPFGRFGRLGP